MARDYARTAGLSAEEGLAVALVELAARDAVAPSAELRADSRAFFVSSWYEDILTFLGQPWVLPAAFYMEHEDG
jgi:hypothetical protein